MFNLGGDKQDPTIFRTIAANTQLRTVFLNQLLDILQRYLPFEGFNLDWQYPEDVDDKVISFNFNHYKFFMCAKFVEQFEFSIGSN